MVDLVRNPGCIEVLKKLLNGKRNWVWTPPANGVIKVNIDGSYLDDLGKWGIREVFRNSKGNVLLQFGKKVNVDSVVHAKVMALREGLLMVAISQWASTHSLEFESDCQSVVA